MAISRVNKASRVAKRANRANKEASKVSKASRVVNRAVVQARAAKNPTTANPFNRYF